jgi:hypothetical protein
MKDSSVSIVTRLRDAQMWLDSRQGQGFFVFTTDTTNLLSNEYWGLRGRGVTLTTNLQLVPK